MAARRRRFECSKRSKNECDVLVTCADLHPSVKISRDPRGMISIAIWFQCSALLCSIPSKRCDKYSSSSIGGTEDNRSATYIPIIK